MKIIFFDGHCPMCHSWVTRLIRVDQKGIFKFAPLESDIARTYLEPLFPGYLEEDTIVYYEDGKVFTRSDAVFRIFSALPFPLHMLKMGMIVPKSLRDGLYRKVAASRYKFGERYTSCPLPPVEWRERFL